MIVLRKAKPSDLPALSRIFINSFSNTSLPVTKNKRVIQEVFELYLSEIFIIAEEKSEPVGLACATENLNSLRKQAVRNSLKWILPWRSYFFSSLHPKYSDKPFFLYLAVSPEHQNKGIGTKLFKKIEHEFKERSIKDIYFQVSAKNKPIINLCKALNCEFIDSVGLINKCLIYKKKLYNEP